MFYISKLIDAILPPRCAFTGNLVDSQGMIAPEAWAGLSFISAPNCHNCGLPFEFAPTAGALMQCAACLTEAPEFSMARAALAYDEASRGFILGFKHGDQTESVVTMVPWLKAAGADFWERADVIVPVPLHRWRLLRRRYNQAALMGRAMARAMEKGFVADALHRTRATPSQGHLKADARKKNVSKAFAVNEKRAGVLKGKNVVLIDDVYTTGATVRECTRVLLAGGAGEVFVLTLARVVKPERF